MVAPDEASPRGRQDPPHRDRDGHVLPRLPRGPGTARAPRRSQVLAPPRGPHDPPPARAATAEGLLLRRGRAGLLAEGQAARPPRTPRARGPEDRAVARDRPVAQSEALRR